MSHEETNPYQIQVTAQSNYLPDQSEPEQDRYVFAYQITIKNTGAVAARLLNRHWIVTDANGQVQEVRGAGVVGKQPYLKPGESFTYTSGTQIGTPIGSMHGRYDMTAEDGTSFDAVIPPFSLGERSRLH